MAIATAVTQTPPPPPLKVIGYELKLTPDEATALADVFAKVGGNTGGRRRHIIAVAAALREAGVRPFYSLPAAERNDEWTPPDVNPKSFFSFTP